MADSQARAVFCSILVLFSPLPLAAFLWLRQLTCLVTQPRGLSESPQILRARRLESSSHSRNHEGFADRRDMSQLHPESRSHGSIRNFENGQAEIAKPRLYFLNMPDDKPVPTEGSEK